MTSPIGGVGSMSDKGIEQLLRKRGVPQAEIQAFIVSKRPSPKIVSILSPGQVQQVVTGGQSDPFGLQPGARQNVAGILGGGSGISGQATNQRGGAIYDAMAASGKAKVGGLPLNQTQGTQLSGARKAPGASSSSTTNRQNLLNRLSDALNLRNKVVGGISRAVQAEKVNNTGSGTGWGGVGDVMDPGEFPTGGGTTPYSAPEISMRDFTGQANDLAAQAYGPLFQAIEAGKTNAQGQYNTSDQVVKGLYDKLVSDTQASGVKQGQQYDQASQEAAGRAKALQDRQGQVYGESANTQTALLERLGQQQSAPQVIAGGLQEQAFQQSQAAQQGDAQQQYYQAGKQNANDYTTGVANAQNTQGTVAREGLVRDLASVLSSFDNQALSGKSQQANTALDLANQLSSRDLQVQTANASNQMGAAQLNQSAEQQALAAQQAAYQNAYSQQRDRRSDFESDRNFELQDSQFRLDQAGAQAKANAAQGSAGGGYIPIGEQGFDSQSAPQQVVAQANSIDPGRGPEYLGLFNLIISQGLNLDQTNMQQFASLAAKQAASSGLSQAAAFAAAASYWKKVMNRS